MHPDTVRRCFDLEAIGDHRFRAAVAGFPGVTWAYGGILIGQCGLAARATGEGRELRSSTVTFVSRTDIDEPVEIDVERVADRGTFATRLIHVTQGGQVRAIATVLLHTFEDGPDHQLPMPTVIGPDQAVPGHPGLPVEVRDASSGRLMSGDVEEPFLDIWYRAPELAHDAPSQEAMVGYISDLSLLEAAWRPVPDATIRHIDRIISSTLSHSMWFHEPPRLHDWVLFHAQSPRAAAGRSLCTAHIFSSDGSLMVSVAQEGLMRFRDGAPRG
ncbi:MAG: thioesterase family protein [Acidimicrobiia bacterium]|nr:thioesterase family protein [Acidimicrobiia bacterium]